jgi:REP element-mobilizing transposase RayT
LFVHASWATFDRVPRLSLELELEAFAVIASQAQRLHCELVVAGGVADHVHVLFRLHPSERVAEVVRSMKAASSRILSLRVGHRGAFRWQGGYGALSVSRADVEKVSDYVRRQKEHHAAGTTIEEFEPPTDDPDDAPDG